MWIYQDTPETPLPSLLIVFPTPPVQSVDEDVRTYARSITSQPSEKRLTIFFESGALSHARFEHVGDRYKCITNTFSK